MADIELFIKTTSGAKVPIKCSLDSTISDLKKLVATQTQTELSKVILRQWGTPLKDHLTVGDYKIYDGMSLDMD